MSKSRASIHPVYAIVSGDRFLLTGALEGVLAALRPETDALGPAQFDGSSAALAEVLDEVRTPSLLGDRRVVIVDEADAFITANRAALERYATDPSPTGSLVLLCRSLPKNTRLRKAIDAVGSVIEIRSPEGREVVPWITARARDEYAKRMSSAAAQRLFEHLGDSTGTLDAELSKLAAYVGERAEITPADVAALTGQHREENVFGVTDAMVAGDVAAALRHWERVLATDRAAPGRAIGGLAWAVRQMLAARREWDRGASAQSLSSRFRAAPAVMQRRLERFTVEQLERQQDDLLAADLALKTGGSTVEAAIEKFIVKHAHVARAGAPARTGTAMAC